MIFKPSQIQELLESIRYYSILFGVEFLGSEPLEPDDRQLLEDYGFDIDKIESKSYVETAYKFGILSKAMGHEEAKKLKYNDFKKWVQRGGYIPLTEEEKLTVDYLKRRSFSHLKKLGNRMSDDFQQILLDEDNKRRQKVEKIIKKELMLGVLDRKSFTDIMLELGHKTGDWSRDWGRIVETELNTCYQEGRADDIQRNNPDEDPLVFKHVYSSACRWCIQAYLTSGLGSQPKIFKLSELRENGTNIGRKPTDWKPTISSTHPWCRCELDDVPKDYEWDDEKKMFLPPKNYKPKIQTKGKIYIKIGDKEYAV